ncbi:MAG TPA: M3 family metallopeptidase [Gemmatimonadales bacterium]|nr:M3 family metallopeptidase [Gemmatimonadales bacterium]
MRHSRTLLAAAALAVVAACGPSKPAAAPFTSANPFASASTLFDQAPPFDRIHDADYQPALEEGMRQQRAEIAAIAADTAAPTFDNTIVAMEKTGALLTRAGNAFNGVTGANTDDTLQRVQTEEAPKLAEHSDAIHLNDTLFRRVKSIYDRRTTLGLDSVQQFLVERYYKDFVQAGALLPDSSKARLRQLNEEESKLSTDFQNRLLAGTKAGAVVVSDKTQLAGMSDAQIAATADAAQQRKLAGKWVIVLQNTTQQPAQVPLENRALRQQLFTASTMRTEHGDSNDTRADIQRLAQLRAEKAKLLGFPTYAAYALDDRMAKTPANAIKLLDDIAAPAVAKARGEIATMQALIDKDKGGFTLAAWDWQHYAEKVRKAQYDLDEEQLKPYFQLDTVLQDGVFYAANQLYGLTFKERKDIPVYQPDVRVFEVFDADGKSLALWYCDYFKRDNKNGGAWESTFVDQSGLIGTHPVVYNVANFEKAAAGQPQLITFDDVTTMFHEFGHALHSMLSNVQYPRLAGTNVPTDFVEFPSQFNEHWALDPKVFAHYARHYQTGAPMPADLVARIHKASTFNQGFATTEYVAASLLDMAWHMIPAGAPLQNVDSFETAALRQYHVDLPEVPPRYHTSYFLHIWANGYQAGYYSYLWSEVIDDDAYEWFVEHGGLTRANGQRFRDMILSRGGTQETADLYRAFRGRDPSADALVKYRGLSSKP